MSTITRWMLAAFVAAVTVTTLLALAPGARAEDNGVGLRPAMGWTSWDFLRHDPTEASVEAQAKAMVTSGLRNVGYQYVNLDDNWYGCPGPQGPDVDRHGRWVVDRTQFPSQGAQNGIQALAGYVHSLGLKFGIYVTPGISKQAVAENTPIEGTRYTAKEIATTRPENNYNCGGMVGIDYSKPGAQAFIDSWADELAHWGVDYVKLDGVGSFDIPDVVAWSKALGQTGRKIHLELSNSLNIHDASIWERYSNGWRTGGDIDCYCSRTSYPLTDWASVESRFDQVAKWAPYGHRGMFNDYDAIEVGNGANDGLTPAERQTQMTLWALGSSQFILGSDLTNLDPLDRSYLLNQAVISVDQDGIDAHRIVDAPAEQVFTKTERSGDAVVGLFNLGGGPAVLSTTAAALGLPSRREYIVDGLWSHHIAETAGRISEVVPSHGVALLRVAPATSGTDTPLTVVTPSGTTEAAGGEIVTERVVFSDEGRAPVHHVRLSLTAPVGWTVTARSPVTVASVAPGQTVSASFRIAIPQLAQPFTTSTLTAAAGYPWAGRTSEQRSPMTVTVSGPAVQAPFATYSSAIDAPAHFTEVGSQIGIEGAGTDLWTGGDDYSAVYSKGVVSTSSTITTEVTSEQNLSGYAKAGIMVRNDIAAAGTAPEGVILYDSPSGGVQLEWDKNAGKAIDAVTPANGTIIHNLPIELRLVRSGDTYTGSYSTDGTTWQPVGRATVPGQAATQDAGMFVTADAAGVPGTATFQDFSAG